MSDIVERLEGAALNIGDCAESETMRAAAQEIRWLRAEVERRRAETTEARRTLVTLGRMAEEALASSGQTH